MSARASQIRFNGKRDQALGSTLNSFISIAEADPEVGDGSLAGAVAGIKDNLAVAGMRMTCASRILENYVAPYDSAVVERLKGEGTLILGKNNMDEFACGSSGENSAFGPTLNPIIEGVVPGGSSSGSAASVAAGLVDFSVGSDTGGSARCPSAYCGTVCLKPTYGRISRYGLADLSMSLESPSPIVQWGEEGLLASVMDSISGEDARDQATSGSRATRCLELIDSFDPESLSIAVPENALSLCSDPVRADFSRCIDFLKGAGAKVSALKLSSLELALPAYYLVMYSEFASAMQRFDGLKFGSRGPGYSVQEAVTGARGMLGREVRRRILMGTYVTSVEGRSVWYERAQAARAAVATEVNDALVQYDMLAMPTMPTPPYGFGERVTDPLLMYATDVLTVPANLAGIPACSMPMGRGTGLQLLSGAGKDELLVSAVSYFHRKGWHWL